MEEMTMLETAEKDNEWMQKNFERIQKGYPNKFVAISERHVIAGGSNSEDVIKEVERQGRDPATTLIEFIPEKGLVLIL